MYEFTTDCLTGIEQIDNEHRELFTLINQSIKMVSETDDINAIAKILQQNLKIMLLIILNMKKNIWKVYMTLNLKCKKRTCSFYKKNQLIRIDTTSDRISPGTSLNELLEFLVRWLYRHILSSDIMIGKFEPDDPFTFTAKYKTDIQLVDDEHRRLFEIIKEANDLIFEELLHDKYDKIIELLSELKDYTEFHFSDEEKLMEKIGYPGLEAQQRAHAAFIEKLVNIDLNTLDDIDNNQQEYLTELINFLLGWLSNHILGSDKKIGEFVKENNIVIS